MRYFIIVHTGFILIMKKYDFIGKNIIQIINLFQVVRIRYPITWLLMIPNNYFFFFDYRKINKFFFLLELYVFKKIMINYMKNLILI